MHTSGDNVKGLPEPAVESDEKPFVADGDGSVYHLLVCEDVEGGRQEAVSVNHFSGFQLFVSVYGTGVTAEQEVAHVK